MIMRSIFTAATSNLPGVAAGSHRAARRRTQRIPVVVALAAALVFTGSGMHRAEAVTYAQGSSSGATHPWVVSIRSASGDPLCTGTLIAAQIVMTAAHCIDGVSKPLSVRAGASNSSVAADAYLVHPRYDRNEYVNDIGLVHLSTPIKANYPSLAPVDDRKLFERYGQDLQVLGWGRDERGTTGQRLRWTSQRDISEKGKSVIGGSFDPRAMIAAGRWEQKLKKYSGACSGDSGGPLATKQARPVVVGVVSFGAERCSTRVPTVYTRVANHSAWLLTNMATLKATAPGVVDVTVNAAPGALIVSVSGAGTRKLDLLCTKSGTPSLLALIGEGSSRIAPVSAGRWTCSARAAGSNGAYSPIGEVVVR
jgi:trypsin